MFDDQFTGPMPELELHKYSVEQIEAAFAGALEELTGQAY